MVMAVTCTRHMHRSHQEVLQGEVLAYASALFSHSLKLWLSHWLFWNFLSCFSSLWHQHDWRHPLVRQATNSSHCSQGCGNCAAQHVTRCSIKWVTFGAYKLSFGFFFFFFLSAHMQRLGRQINPAVASVQELKITDNCCPVGMSIHHCKYSDCAPLHLFLGQQMWMQVKYKLFSGS